MREPDDPPMAIDNPPGDARPVYDQYALNDPNSRNKPAQVARRARGAADDDGAADLETAAVEQQQGAGSFGSARPGEIFSRAKHSESDGAEKGSIRSKSNKITGE